MAVKKLLQFPHKRIRSKVIKQYMIEGGYNRAVCFTCGNAGIELKLAGIDTIMIGCGGDLLPSDKWFSTAEVHKMFPDCFDATSGHLPTDLMYRIGLAYKEYLGELSGKVYVPSGSGETIVCLKLVYPKTEFIAVYDINTKELKRATSYSKYAPLNKYVELLSKVQHGV